MLMLSHWVHITNCRLLSIFLPMALFRESVHWSAIITVPENTKESVTYFIRHLHWLPLSCLPDFCSAGLLRECSYRFLHPHRKRLPSEQRLCGSSSLGFIFFLRFCYLLWCFGRARCRNAISVHFASPLSGHHPSCRTAFYPLSGCYRCMDCLSVYGNTHCMLCMDHLSAKNTAYVPLRTFAVFFLLCYG